MLKNILNFCPYISIQKLIKSQATVLSTFLNNFLGILTRIYYIIKQRGYVVSALGVENYPLQLIRSPLRSITLRFSQKKNMKNDPTYCLFKSNYTFQIRLSIFSQMRISVRCQNIPFDDLYSYVLFSLLFSRDFLINRSRIKRKKKTFVDEMLKGNINRVYLVTLNEKFAYFYDSLGSFFLLNETNYIFEKKESRVSIFCCDIFYSAASFLSRYVIIFRKMIQFRVVFFSLFRVNLKYYSNTETDSESIQKRRDAHKDKREKNHTLHLQGEKFSIKFLTREELQICRQDRSKK